ncbi:hypothetical protein UlMin_023489 [Ulmus minor]
MKNKQVSTKVEPKVDDDDHIPISQRIKKSTVSNSKSSSTKQPLKKVVSSSFKKTNKKMKKTAQNSKYSKSTKVLPISGDGQKKWTTLVHNGVIFPPAYKPHGVKMLYNGKPVDLTPEQEEVATMFTVMKDTEYVQKQTFRQNFWIDWRKLLGKNHVIQNLDTCDFTPIYDWYQNEKEQKKQMSTDEKKALKEDKSKQEEKYMWAVVDDVKEKVSNFRVEPPGLFRGHEEHPKSGKLKRRIRPSNVTINIGNDAPLPKCPIPGERWREIRHDNIVIWLFKYVFLAASSSLRGKDYIAKIRQAYERDFTSSDVLTSLANFRKLYKYAKYVICIGNNMMVKICCDLFFTRFYKHDDNCLHLSWRSQSKNVVKFSRLLITGADTAVVKTLPNLFHRIFRLRSKDIFLVFSLLFTFSKSNKYLENFPKIDPLLHTRIYSANRGTEWTYIIETKKNVANTPSKKTTTDKKRLIDLISKSALENKIFSWSPSSLGFHQRGIKP